MAQAVLSAVTLPIVSGCILYALLETVLIVFTLRTARIPSRASIIAPRVGSMALRIFVTCPNLVGML